MVEIKISDLLDYIQDDGVSFEVKEVVSAENIKETAMKRIHTNTNSPRKRAYKTVLAAIITAFALTGTALAIYHFGIKDLEGPVMVEAEKEVRVLSINGIEGSTEYEAAEEWEDYLMACDEEGTNLMSPDHTNDEYSVYGAFSQEAKDKLHEVLEKYDLKMHDITVEVRSPDELYSRLKTREFLPAGGDSGEYPELFRGYDDGSIAGSYAATLPDGSNVRYQLYCQTKGSLTSTGYLLADASEFEDWIYTSSGGEEVLLAISESRSVMAVDLDSSFVFVNILSGSENRDENKNSYGEETMDKRKLEAFAEGFDFEVINNLAK